MDWRNRGSSSSSSLVVFFATLAVVVVVVVNGQSDEVALIIGGVSFCSSLGQCSTLSEDQLHRQQQAECDDPASGIVQLNHVEIFGCPTDVDPVLASFPYDVTFTSGVWLAEERKAVVCGGLDCFNLNVYGTSRAECYWWDPLNSETGSGWIPAENMTHGRAAHIVGTVTESATGRTRVYAAGGYPDSTGANFTTEYLLDDGWVGYRNLPPSFEPHDNAYGCMLQHGDMLYSVRNRVTQLNLDDWAVTDLGPTPLPLGNVGQCAYGTFGGQPGILVRNGHWFNLMAPWDWQTIERQPTPPSVTAYTMATLNGKATIFGLPECTGMICKTGTSVVQYDDFLGQWVPIGDMVQERLWQRVIPVPAEVCDLLASKERR